ncbi:MAG: DUF885 domain-containing protein [Chloroflexi bacterium]|nr:DUF885 domain-containing protein [Chloroflexota bacterium]
MTAETFVPLVDDTRPTARTRFEHALHALLGDYFEAFPVWATATGYHLVDDRWGDMTDEGRRRRIEILRRHQGTFESLPDGELSAGERIDRSIVLEMIDQLRFDEEILREARWDPLVYVYVLGSGFFGLLAREYGPWAHRGNAFLHRVRGIPHVLEAARAELVGLPGRPVSLLHTETAAAQIGGIGDLIDEGMAEATRRAEAGEEPGLPEALQQTALPAKAALAAFREALDSEIRERAVGEGRLGPELFGQKLRHTLSSDLGHEELRERAWHEYREVRAEMVRLSRELWPSLVPDRPMPDRGGAAETDQDVDSAIVRGVLDAIAQEHRQPHELLEWCQAEVARIEDFCRGRSLIGLPDEPLRITWTPVFMRAYGRAFLDSPGPLDRGQSSYFWITPPDESGAPEDVESYLREDNDRMLRLLCIHEGVPGHYLQLAWSNRSPSLVRSIFSNGMFAEGWAVYVTQVMMDLGYDADDPALMLTHWKFYLRAVTNAIMDVEIHAGSMDEQAAMDLMVKGGFQEPDEARAKWLRARLTSTQLCTYYLGSLEMWDMEVAARHRAATAAGAGADVVPSQRIVGGLGETPGFDYRKHLESVISHGSPAIKWVARILADGA